MVVAVVVVSNVNCQQKLKDWTEVGHI